MRILACVLTIVIGVAIMSFAQGTAINTSPIHHEISILMRDFHLHPRTNMLVRFTAFHEAHPSSSIATNEINDYANFMYYYGRLLRDLTMYDESVDILEDILVREPPPWVRKDILLLKAQTLRAKARQSTSPERDILWESAIEIVKEAEAITNSANQAVEGTAPRGRLAAPHR